VPTKTLSRTFPNPTAPFWHSVNGQVTRRGSMTLTGATFQQTTTSYRSSERLDRGTSARDSLDGKELRKTLGQDRGVLRRQYDTGHDFLTQKWWTDFGLTAIRLKSPPTPVRFEYMGPLSLNSAISAGVFLPDIGSYTPAQSQIMADGRKMIQRTIPTAPEVSLATFLAEIKREGLPHLTGTILRKKGLSLANAGGEYLNYQFGIAPTISDVQKMAQSVLKANKMVREMQYQRNSDTVVRKKATLEETNTAVVLKKDVGWGYPMIESDGISPQNTMLRYYDSQGIVTCIDNINSRTWFSGAWSYHLAESHSFLGKLEHYEQKANHLLGTRFTPETIWELTPWSWLIDYFSDAGTFISNVTALSSDSLVLRYGYVMHETFVDRSMHMSQFVPKVGAVAPREGVVRHDYFHEKRRTRSTPYGFGVDLGALSPRRWAILSALGFTKTEKGLNVRTV